MTNLTKPAKQQRYQFVLDTGHNAFLKLEILEWLESRGPYYIGVTIPPENNPSDYGFKVNSNHSPYYITFCHDHEASVALYKLTFL
jgi:hypothetical protein